jgi:hypothetical protein
VIDSARLDPLARALGLGPSAEPILAAIDALYARLDPAVAARAASLELPCRAGCDACCHESVFLSAPEFLRVAAELVETRAPAELERVIAEMLALAERFSDELELLEEINPGAERDEVAARIKFRCPLLAADGRCTVYRARELNGRTFGQSWDAARGEVYGCELTHQRLRVLGSEAGAGLYGAREARRELTRAVPGTERVRVYPWWFRACAAELRALVRWAG